MRRSTRKILSFLLPLVAIFFVVVMVYVAYNKASDNKGNIENKLEEAGGGAGAVSENSISNTDSNTENSVMVPAPFNDKEMESLLNDMEKSAPAINDTKLESILDDKNQDVPASGVPVNDDKLKLLL